jgi:hypothetical protein
MFPDISFGYEFNPEYQVKRISRNIPIMAIPMASLPATPNPEFKAIDSTVASIIKTFDATSWKNHDGYTSMTFDVQNVQNDMFFRIRGTNLGYDVKQMDSTGTKIVYGTDASGSSLINTPGTSNADMAWDDLWFYSNPVVVKVVEKN